MSLNVRTQTTTHFFLADTSLMNTVKPVSFLYSSTETGAQVSILTAAEFEISAQK